MIIIRCVWSELSFPNEACLLPPSISKPRNFDDYWEELVLSLSTARSNVVSCTRQLRSSKRRVIITQPGRFSSKSDSGSLSGFLEETGNNLNPGMARTRLSTFNILLARSTTLMRNPFRYTSRECARVPSLIQLDTIGTVDTNKELDITSIGLTAWSLAMVHYQLHLMRKVKCRNKQPSTMPSGTVQALELRESSSERWGWCDINVKAVLSLVNALFLLLCVRVGCTFAWYSSCI